MMTRLIALTLFALLPLAAPLAEGPEITITLGIRDTEKVQRGKAKYPAAFRRIEYPLAFRIQNHGKTVIASQQIVLLYFKGIIHISSSDGWEEQAHVQQKWRTMVQDLKPGATVVSPVYADLLTYFPSLKDGVYRVWWALEGQTSNVVRFTIVKGKVTHYEPET